jgi:hypothetical protein
MMGVVFDRVVLETGHCERFDLDRSEWERPIVWPVGRIPIKEKP